MRPVGVISPRFEASRRRRHCSTIFRQTALEIWKIIRDFNNYPVCDAGGSRIEDSKPGAIRDGCPAPTLTEGPDSDSEQSKFGLVYRVWLRD